MPIFRTWLVLAVLLCASAAQAIEDPVTFSFATVGDSRAEPGPELNAQDARWLQATRPYARILREIQAVHPNALFFNGDMILGYSLDKHELDRQYAFWRGMVAGLMEAGVYVVPVPGNHEVQNKVIDSVTGKTAKRASVVGENSWRENMGDLIFDKPRWTAITGNSMAGFDVNNAPPINGADNITTDQRQLSYSFDVNDSHFVVINTDPTGMDGRPPVNWLREDLAAAKTRGARHVFVFGHKPAFTYFFTPIVNKDGFDLFPEAQKEFWQLIEDSHATYFCGHEHIFNLSQPTKSAGGHSWQVIVGTAGSPFSARPGVSSNPDDRTYAWAVVSIHRSGKVHIEIVGFSDSFGSTRQLRAFDIEAP